MNLKKITSRWWGALSPTLIILFLSHAAWGTVTGFTPCSALPSQSPTPTADFCTDPVNPPSGYASVSGVMTGTASSFGSYAAPITLMYPANPLECSGTAIVDLINNSATVFAFADFFGTVYLPPAAIGRGRLGNDYIGKNGQVLALLQHQGAKDKGWPTFPIAMPFVIPWGITNGYYPPEAGIPVGPVGSEFTPTYIVMNDAAEFIKNPSGFGGPAVCSSNKAIAIGVSRSALHLRQFLDTDPPSSLGALHYDGSFLHEVSLFEPLANPAPPSGTGKAIVVNTETDIMFFLTGGNPLVPGDQGMRADTGDYKVYEMAGVSHSPIESGDLAALFAPVLPGFPIPQNPAKLSPVIRTMMTHLVEWIDGTSTPPPSVYLGTDGDADPDECFVASGGDFNASIGIRPLDNYCLSPTGNPCPPPAPNPSEDRYLDCPRGGEDGAMAGGLRLPHVVTEVDGELAGAPLGGYNGLNTATPWKLLPHTPPFLFGLPRLSNAIAIGGRFDRFTDQELIDRYGTNTKVVDDAISGQYIGAVARAAEYAESQGWISEDEKRDYIQTAQDCAHGKTGSLTDLDLRACHGL